MGQRAGTDVLLTEGWSLLALLEIAPKHPWIDPKSNTYTIESYRAIRPGLLLLLPHTCSY